jgi:hypothetical protein
MELFRWFVRQRLHRGLEPGEPLAVAVDALDGVPRRDEPVDERVQRDAVVVGVEHVVGAIPSPMSPPSVVIDSAVKSAGSPS